MERITRAAAALGLNAPRLSGRRLRYILALVMLVTTMQSGSALAAGTLTSTSVSLSDPRPSATGVDYSFSGSSVDTSAAILCVKVVWSTTSGGDTAPSGFDGTAGTVTAASSTLIGSTSTNWSLARSDGTSSSGQNNIFEYTNSSTGFTPSSSPRTFVLGGITNPSTPDTVYYLKLSTFGNTDCTSSPIDNAIVGFINTSGQTLSLTIDNTLSFTVGGVASGQSCGGGTTGQLSTATTLPFGSVNSGANVIVCQDLQAATNAANGYSIYTRYTGAPSDGLGHTIADVSPGTNTTPAAFSGAGTEAYGYTTDDQTLSDCSGSCSVSRFYNGATYDWAAMTTGNSEVAYEASGVVGTTYRVGHQVGIATTTNAGNYSTTVIYTCTPVY